MSAESTAAPGGVRVRVVSAGWVHPSLPARSALDAALASTPGVRLEPASGVEALRAPGALRDVGALVLYFHRRTISTEALAAVDAAVRDGCGVLAVHAAAASFKACDEWFALLGGRFVRHGPVQRFQVRPCRSPDLVFGEVAPFEVRDELYRHIYDPGNRIHFETVVDGEREPVVWTRTHGRGRVCYLSLGHKAGSLRHPSVQGLVRSGLRFAAGLEPAETDGTT